MKFDSSDKKETQGQSSVSLRSVISLYRYYTAAQCTHTQKVVFFSYFLFIFRWKTHSERGQSTVIHAEFIVCSFAYYFFTLKLKNRKKWGEGKKLMFFFLLFLCTQKCWSQSFKYLQSLELQRKITLRGIHWLRLLHSIVFWYKKKWFMVFNAGNGWKLIHQKYK